MASIAERLYKRLDGWASELTGLGTSRDKATSYRFSPSMRHDMQALENIFEGDDMAARVCEKPAEHMLRRGFSVNISADGEHRANIETAISARIDDLHLVEKLVDALVWEEVFGGAAIFIGADDGNPPDEALDLETVRSLTFLNVIDARDIVPWSYQSDPGLAGFGNVDTYRLYFNAIPLGYARSTAKVSSLFEDNRSFVDIHSSRLVVFPGLRTTLRKRVENSGWGGSRIERIKQPLAMFNSNWMAVSNLMQDASQAVFRIKGLIDMITSGSKDALQTRMEMVDMARSVARAILVDADVEDFTRNDTSMSGLPELLDRTCLRYAAAADMPVSVLMGREPAGLNATGEADVNNWYDNLDARRTSYVLPRLTTILRVLLNSADGPTAGVEPEMWSVKFAPFRQLDDAQQAQLELSHAQADQIRIASGVVLPEEVTASRYRAEGYSNELRIDASTRDVALKNALAALESGVDDMPPTPVGGSPTPALPTAFTLR